MTALIIIASILLFLLLLLISPVRFEVRYGESLIFKARYWFFTYQIVPQKEKKKKQKRKKSKDTGKKQKKSEKKSPFSDIIKEKGLKGFLALVKEIGRIAGGTLKKLLRHIVIKNLLISVLVAGDDAADTALKYGKVCAVVYPVAGLIISNTKCKQYAVQVTPGFQDKESAVVCEAELKIKLFYLLGAALSALWRFVKLMAAQKTQPQQKEKD